MRRRRVLVAVAVAAALVVAGLSGWYPWAKLAPKSPIATIRPGQSAELGGVRYRLRTFEVAPSLPADEPDDPPRAGPAGSVLVLVVLDQTVLDHGVALDEVGCDVTLVDAAGTTTWEPDTEATSLIARPEARSCGDLDDAPLRYDEPRAVGFSFDVPAGATEQATVRLELRDGPTLALAR